MKIVFKDTFINRLTDQVEFIAEASPNRARKFKINFSQKLKRFQNSP